LTARHRVCADSVSLNAIATPAAEQIEPRLGRFGVPLVKRDGFLGGVRADADHHQ
jgi:hypothetical protein